jgi:signal transduction histidine kinase
MEGVTNALRHARATEVALTLAHDGARLTLQVDDDGSTPFRSDSLGRGLSLARRRAEHLGGTLAVGPAGERGTRFRVVLPLGAPALTGQAERPAESPRSGAPDWT